MTPSQNGKHIVASNAYVYTQMQKSLVEDRLPNPILNTKFHFVAMRFQMLNLDFK